MKISFSSSPFKKFADRHSLVYAGTVHDDDDHEPIRGVTLSTKRHDKSFVQGNLEGLDLRLVHREVNFSSPAGADNSYEWSIMELILHTQVNLPHVFIDSHNRYEEEVYKAIFTKFSRLVLADDIFTNSDPGFLTSFRVFCNPETKDELTRWLPSTITTIMASDYRMFDFETLENKVYVYAPGLVGSDSDLEHMLEATKLLAENFSEIVKQL